MNRPQTFPEARTDGGVDITPCLRPGETLAEFERRVAAEEAAFQRQMAEIRVRGLSTDLVAGSGLYDGNGNPKGSGWF